MHQWWIYKISNPVGRIYIGKTSNLKQRLSQYKSLSGGGCNQQPILYNSLLKYGYNYHKIEVIETFTSDNTHANDKEMFWIRSYMSNANKWITNNGMNLSDGGDGNIGAKFPNRVSPMKGKKMPEEAKRKLRERNRLNPPKSFLGRKHTDETKRKMSDLKKGKTPIHLVGKKYSAERIKAMSEMMKGKPSPFLGKHWSKEDKIRIGLSKIGNKNMLGKKLSNEVKKIISEYKSMMGGKRVLLYDLHDNLIREYKSIKDLAEFVGKSSGFIGKCLAGKKKFSGNYKFKFK